MVDIDFWTSATDVGCDDKYLWCSGSKDFNHDEVNWKDEQPKSADGDCVFLQFSNTSVNLSTYSLGSCAEEKRFICEVFCPQLYT